MKTKNYYSFAFLCIAMLLLSFTNPNKPIASFKGDACSLSLEKNINYSIENKKSVRDFDDYSPPDALVVKNLKKGKLGLCISDTKGHCKWTFTSKSIQKKSIEIAGIQEVIKTLLFSKSSTAVAVKAFLKTAKKQGAKITNLGKGVMSVRKKDSVSRRTIITLVDTKNNVILGSSVYKNDSNLEAKLVFTYKQNTPASFRLLKFDGSTSFTEIIATF